MQIIASMYVIVYIQPYVYILNEMKIKIQESNIDISYYGLYMYFTPVTVLRAVYTFCHVI